MNRRFIKKFHEKNKVRCEDIGLKGWVPDSKFSEKVTLPVEMDIEGKKIFAYSSDAHFSVYWDLVKYKTQESMRNEIADRCYQCGISGGYFHVGKMTGDCDYEEDKGNKKKPDLICEFLAPIKCLK